MEERCHRIRLRINPCEVWPFVQVTIDTRKGKILQIVIATMFSGSDVFNVEASKGRVILMKLTIFAPVPRTLANENPCRLVHPLDWEPRTRRA